MIYLGIDPGAEGAIAIFDDLVLLHVFDTPIIKIEDQKIMDVNSALSTIGEYADKIDMVFIEKVGARHGQGVKSMFSFGERFAEVKTLALMLTNDIHFITPQKWKGQAGLIGTDKKESAIKCSKIYPKKKELFVKENKRCKSGFKMYDGRGDAVLIGLMGYKNFK